MALFCSTTHIPLVGTANHVLTTRLPARKGAGTLKIEQSAS
jgi:hypothetical protein